MLTEHGSSDRSAAAEALVSKAGLATACGNRAKAAELAEAAMYLDPTPQRIREWALASAQVGSASHREALLEVASWF